MSVEEFNTDGISVVNDEFVVKFRLLVIVDGEKTWHYYGTVVPGESISGVPTMQHDAVTVQLADFASAACDVARGIAVDGLSAE